MTSRAPSLAVIASLCAAPLAHAAVDLVATAEISGAYEDLSSKTADALENGIAGNRFGGIGSGLAWAGGAAFPGAAGSRTQCGRVQRRCR